MVLPCTQCCNRNRLWQGNNLPRQANNDRKVSYNRPDVKVTDKEEKTWCNVGLRFQWIMEEKIDKYIDFAAEV